MGRLSLHILAAALLLAASCKAEKPVYDDPEAAAAGALCERIVGPRAASSFVFRNVTENGKKDFFRLSSEDGRIVIKGNNANSLATGFHYYLKYYCKVSLGFYKPSKVKLPSMLPRIDEPIEVEAACPNRFFLNYCTFGYSMPWWGWEEWEYFIDWMAMNGVNLPLSITGQESIWYRVWTEMGIDDKTVRSYFTGPAHLPWHRMSNIDEWGGPLPQSWLDGQEELQKKIVSRERELGMRPVLPAFAGHVPEQLVEVYPEAKIDRLGLWEGFSEAEVCSFLDPTDSLFGVIQRKFLEKEIELYGTDHIYGIDLFNEVTPPSWEPDYLAMVGEQVYGTLASVDPDAVWLQMAWLFYYKRLDWTPERVKAYITSYPADKSLLLDYYCERSEVWKLNEQFSGVPFLWCYLGNFGGNMLLKGALPTVRDRIDECFETCENLVGIGSTLEGLDVCNQIMYDYVLERAWNIPGAASLEEYIKGVADSHCGFESENGRKAWKLMLDNVYSKDRSGLGRCIKVNSRPTFGKEKPSWARTDYLYDNNKLLEAIRLLLSVDSQTDAYELDLVNLTRQWLGNISAEIFDRYESACSNADIETMDILSTQFMELVHDLDALLACREEFSLGKWIADARAWGMDKSEKDYYECNARNILTTWGRQGSALTDYANRSLSGLTENFYGGRWRMFFSHVREAVTAKGSFDEGDLENYLSEVKAFEGQWWEDRVGEFTSKTAGNLKKKIEETVSKFDSSQNNI